MSPERWQRINSIFVAASELDGDERVRTLDELCVADSDLRLEVERLLAHHQTESNQLDRLQARVASLHRASRTSALPPGKLLAGRFHVIRFLGAGGMGEVYEVLDQELNSHVGMKALHNELAGDPKILDRFRQEIQMARRVTHPNVCRVFDMFRHEEPGHVIHFLTMELISGETLSNLLRRDGPMNTGHALGILRQLAVGLAAAHAAKVVHRDFKSANVMLDETGRVVITDFGMARDIAPVPGKTVSSSSVALGTPAYMAPEQIEGKSATAETDIYALGVVIYEMVTGVLPYSNVTPLAMAARKVKEPPRPPTEIRTDLPRRWEQVILRCLARNPKDRFSSALQVLAAVDTGSPAKRSVSRRVAAAAIVLLGSGAIWYWRASSPRHNIQAERMTRLGAESFLAGSYLNAGLQLTEALRLDSHSIPARSWLVHVRSATRRHDAINAAIAELDRDSASPTRSEQLLLESARLAVAGQFSAAAQQLAGAAAQESGETGALLLAASAHYYLKAGNAELAAQTAAKALQLDPHSGFAHLQIAAAHSSLGRTDAALQANDAAKREFELGPFEYVTEVELQRAAILRVAGRAPESRKVYELVLSRVNAMDDPIRRVHALRGLDRVPEAIAAAREHKLGWLVEDQATGFPPAR